MVPGETGLAIPRGGRHGRTLLVCAALCLLASLLMALTRQEFITAFHKASLHRYTDVQLYVHHQVHGSTDDLHPVFGGYLRLNWTAPVALAMLLVRMGCPGPLAINVVALLMRTLFGLGISGLFLAAMRKRHVALLGVALAYVLPSNANIYGHLPQYALSGFAATSCFLLACSFLLLGCRRWAVSCWLLHLWIHPTTFVAWSPFFIGLLLATGSVTKAAFTRWLRPYGFLLVLGPAVAAMAAGLAERGGLLPFRGDEYYWALTRIKANHSVFLFNATYVLTLQYFAAVAALLILARTDREGSNPLTTLNLLAGLGGLGIGVMYLATVETHFSVAANMCLPLRFECVMYPLILANVAHAAFCFRPDRPQAGLLAGLYGAILFFPQFKPLLWAWFWALGQDWLSQGPNRTRRHIWGAVGGALVVLGYLAFGPSGRTISWNCATAAPFLAGGAMVACAAGLAFLLRRHWPRPLFVAAVAGCLLIGPRIWMTNPAWLQEELKAVSKGQNEQSPEKEACDWLNSQVAPGTPVLTYNALYIHRVTHVRTCLNKDIIDYFVYSPGFARPLAEELRDLYGLDVLAMARRGERLNLTHDDWYAVRTRVLETGHAGDRAYDYIIEPARLQPGDGRIVFSNSFARIYEAGPGRIEEDLLTRRDASSRANPR